MQGFGLEGGAVGGDESPMSDLTAEQADTAERGEVAKHALVGQIGGLGEDEPDTVVFGVPGAVAQLEHDPVAHIDGETREHGQYFRLERSQGFENERVGGRSAFGLNGLGDSAASGHSARIARRNRMSRNQVRRNSSR